MSLSNLISDRRVLVRLILLISAPLALSIALSLFILSSTVVSNINRQAVSFGQVMAAQLAVSASEYMLAGDLLSLNVLLADLVEQRHLKGASIYSADNRLLVEAGRTAASEEQLFTAEIHYQDSIAGYIRVALDEEEQRGTIRRASAQIILLNLLLLLGSATLIWRYPERVARLLQLAQDVTTPEGSPIEPLPPLDHATLEQVAVESDPELDPLPVTRSDDGRALTLLVLKLKPARLARELDGAINQAIALYQGEIVAQQEGEWTAQFKRSGDHCFQAICAGLVVRRLITERASALTYNGGIHCGEKAADADARAAGKQAIYLASLGSGKLLASDQPLQQPAVIDRVEISEFHSFLAPESQVFSIDALKDPYQALIDRQAQKLKAPHATRRESLSPRG